MTGSVIIKAQGLKEGDPEADAFVAKMRDVGIAEVRICGTFRLRPLGFEM